MRIVTDVAIDDVTRYLTRAESEDLDRLKLPARRLERAASRIAGKLLIAETYDVENPDEVEFTKNQDRPHAMLRGISAPFSVSFTHSHGIGAAAAGDNAVGVDVEMFREIRREMTRFFLSAEELASAMELEIEHPLLHYWSAKEAAFKMSDRFPTLLRVPLEIVSVRSSGLTFEIEGLPSIVETDVIGSNLVAALARSVSPTRTD